MWNFSVWAPKARAVSVRVDGRDYAMDANDLGWWKKAIAEAGPGTDYFFVLDGGKAVPDPRSQWQPEGVHGPSRVVDHSVFPWTDRAFVATALAQAIVYELHVGTFTPAGTFESAIERLDYLKDLGITHVELMPVNEFSGDWGWGYDGVDLFAPHHAYGSPDALKRLVDACHARGMAAILDVVYNHFGPTGNYLSMFGPYFTKHYATPWGEAINLDGPGSLEVRRFFCDNALHWLRDYHFDGLRLDAIHALLDQSAIHFLEQLAGEVRAFSASKVLIAESDLNDPRVVRPTELGGYGMDAQWSDDFHHALHSALTGETSGYYEDFGSLEALAGALTNTFVYDGRYSRHRQRIHGRPATGVSSHRFLGYAQTHDQVGNRAQGERLSHLAGSGRVKIGAALVLLSPFIPMLFQGEEFAASTPFQYFTHHEEEDLGRAVSEGRKREFAAFGWKPEDVPDPQDPRTFQRSKLLWQELESADHKQILDWYRALIRLRKTTPALSAERDASMAVDWGEAWIRLDRGGCAVFCNLAPHAQGLLVGKFTHILLASDESARIDHDTVVLPGESAVVLSIDSAPV